MVTVSWMPAGCLAGRTPTSSRPCEMGRHGPWLAEPFGRIHLAGEHTDQWQATMNGALASGVRAAHEILGGGPDDGPVRPCLLPVVTRTQHARRLQMHDATVTGARRPRRFARSAQMPLIEMHCRGRRPVSCPRTVRAVRAHDAAGRCRSRGVVRAPRRCPGERRSPAHRRRLPAPGSSVGLAPTRHDRLRWTPPGTCTPPGILAGSLDADPVNRRRDDADCCGRRRGHLRRGVWP